MRITNKKGYKKSYSIYIIVDGIKIKKMKIKDMIDKRIELYFKTFGAVLKNE